MMSTVEIFARVLQIDCELRERLTERKGLRNYFLHVQDLLADLINELHEEVLSNDQIPDGFPRDV